MPRVNAPRSSRHAAGGPPSAVWLCAAALAGALAWPLPGQAQTNDRWPLGSGKGHYEPAGDKLGQITAKDKSVTRLYLARTPDGRSLTLTEVEHDSSGALDSITVHTVVPGQLAPEGASGSSVEKDEANDHFGRAVSVGILLCRGVNQACIQRQRVGPVDGRVEPLSGQTFFKAHFDRAPEATAFLKRVLKGS